MPLRGLDSLHTYSEIVAVTTNAALTLTAPGATLDGYTFVSGDRVLVKDQASATDNGIYIWNGAAVAMTRAYDAFLCPGMTVRVINGTFSGGTQWILSSPSVSPVIAGGTALTFVRSDGTDAWSSLIDYTGTIAAGTVAGTYLLSTIGGTNTVSTAAINAGSGICLLDPSSNYLYSGRTHQVRVAATVTNWGAAQTGSFTFGIYPITAISTTGIPTLGTAISTVAISAPANGSLSAGFSAPVSMPISYVSVAVVTSATIAASSTLITKALLQIREI